MLTENDVVQFVGSYLTVSGYEIKQQLMTTQQGIDIIATKNGTTLLIEAKGATSTKMGTNRYGIGFSRNQVNHHVAVAFYTMAKLMTKYSDDSYLQCIALPYNKHHIDAVEAINSTIEKLGIVIIWVDYNGNVIVNKDF